MQNALQALSTYAPSEKQPIEIVVKPYKHDHTLQQQRTLRWWYNIWSGDDTVGRPPEQLHQHCKKFVLQILERDDEVYAKKMDDLRKRYRSGDIEGATSEHATILWLISTTQLGRGQMKEYMELVRDEAARCGCPDLPEPDWRKRSGR